MNIEWHRDAGFPAFELSAFIRVNLRLSGFSL